MRQRHAEMCVYQTQGPHDREEGYADGDRRDQACNQGDDQKSPASPGSKTCDAIGRWNRQRDRDYCADQGDDALLL